MIVPGKAEGFKPPGNQVAAMADLPRIDLASVDWEACAKEAEAWIARLDQFRKDLEETERGLRKAAEEQALAWVKGAVPAGKQAEAERLVHDGARILEEVGSWLVSRSPIGLAQRLLPEFRTAAEDARAFLA